MCIILLIFPFYFAHADRLWIGICSSYFGCVRTTSELDVKQLFIMFTDSVGQESDTTGMMTCPCLTMSRAFAERLNGPGSVEGRLLSSISPSLCGLCLISLTVQLQARLDFLHVSSVYLGWVPRQKDRGGSILVVFYDLSFKNQAVLHLSHSVGQGSYKDLPRFKRRKQRLQLNRRISASQFKKSKWGNIAIEMSIFRKIPSTSWGFSAVVRVVA